MPLLVQKSVLQKEARVKETVFRWGKKDRAVACYSIWNGGRCVLGRLRRISRYRLWIGVSADDAAYLLEGKRIEVVVPWPIKLDGVTELNFCVSGHLLKARSTHVVMSVQKHEFRTRRRLPLGGVMG